MLLGFAKQIERSTSDDDGPKPKIESYKTIWIAPQGSNFKFIQKEGFLIAPGNDGFYKLERIKGKREGEKSCIVVDIDKVITYRVGSEHDTK